MDELARTAGRGDDAALAILLQRTQADVWRLCAHLVGPASADDLGCPVGTIRSSVALFRHAGQITVDAAVTTPFTP